MQSVFPLLKYKSLCDSSTHHLYAACTEQGLSCLTFPLFQRIIQLVLWTIRQQSCTRKQICTCKSFGISDRNFRRYRFVPWYRIVVIWFTKSVVLCAAMGEMAGETAPAKWKQHTCHMESAWIAQAFVFE